MKRAAMVALGTLVFLIVTAVASYLVGIGLVHVRKLLPALGAASDLIFIGLVSYCGAYAGAVAGGAVARVEGDVDGLATHVFSLAVILLQIGVVVDGKTPGFQAFEAVFAGLVSLGGVRHGLAA